MARVLDNLDDVLQTMAQMETAVDMEVVRDARKKMRATMRTYLPRFKKLDPPDKQTGALVKSAKVKSRSRRGKTTVSIVWGVEYAGYVNFNKNTKASGFVSDEFKMVKPELDKKGEKDVKEAFKSVLENYGVRVEL